MSERRGRIAGALTALLALANGAIVVSLWWRAGGVSEIEDTASALTGLGRLCGLLGAYLVLVQVLLLARIPVLDRAVGFDRLTCGTASTARSRCRC